MSLCAATIPGRAGEIVFLYFQGHAYKDIAFRTNSPIGTVSKTIFVARRRGLVGRRNRKLVRV